MKPLKFGAGLIVAIVIWGGLVLAALDGGWGHAPIAKNGDAKTFARAANRIAKQRNAGNLSFVLIEDGTEVESFHLSKDKPVNRQTVFQVASLGKWLTAWGVMALVEDGQIDLDAPIAVYLSRWQLPASEFDKSGVTVRRLLSHTAGLTDGLGYDGFDREDARQTLEASLTKAADASPGNDGVTMLGREPGSGFQYSGGGYTILQLIIEEVSGQTFTTFMKDRVFDPLAMNRTTFDHREAIELGLAQNFGPDGQADEFRWYTALAATSLFTTSEDLTTFVMAQAPGSSNPVLSKETLALMREAHASQMGADIWGLGAMLYAPNNANDFIVGHDGSNEPAINTAARLDPATGDGIVVLSTGSPMLATEIAGEWVFWKTGNVDSLTFAARLPSALIIFSVGVLLIMLSCAALVWKRRGADRPRSESRVMGHALAIAI